MLTTDWKDRAKKLRFEDGKSWTQVADALKGQFPDLNQQQILEKVRGVLRRTEEYRKKGAITYEDKKEPSEMDVSEYYESLKRTNSAILKLDRKQNRANVSIDSDKPIAVAFWGDWHLGAKGIDYDLHDRDTGIIAKTDRLYYIGMGDYKDNASGFVHPASTHETVAPTDMQDKIVEMKVEQTADKTIALTRGCHDDWDKRNANKDMLESLCEISNSINLWHGGIINLSVGAEEYRIAARHKYKNESGLNTTNTQRNFINEFGHCDVVAFGHKHYCELQHTRRMKEETIYIRSGTYKLYDEFGQKIGGYSGEYGVPVVIFYPDRHEMIPVRSLEMAAILLKQL